jgi:hypothetical protein
LKTPVLAKLWRVWRAKTLVECLVTGVVLALEPA